MIEVRDLSKSYGKKVVVDHLSFVVPDGCVTGFLGPNGSGKSTTMRCMLGLDHHGTGEVRFDGARLGEIPHALTVVGSLLDAKYVNPSRSARNHLRYLAASNGLPTSRVDEVLDIVGMTSVAKQRVGTFSLGMHQRLGIAGALLGKPKAYLFDEPVNGLDPEGILWVRQFIRYLASQGAAVLVSSHLLSEMANTADNLVVIGQGKLISQGRVDDFVSANVDEWVEVRSPSTAVLANALAQAGARVQPTGPDSLKVTEMVASRVGEVAAANQIVLHELTTRHASLEEAYLRATAGVSEYVSRPVGRPLPPPGAPQ